MIPSFNKILLSNRALLLVTISLTTLLFTGCNKDDEDNNVNNPGQGAIRPVGELLGPVISKRIGISGGTISSADQRISIEIPAGALDAEQDITIQSIENTNEPGLGIAYRLSPHGVVFKNPVSISFSYESENLSTTLPELLGIAYQNETGIWMAVGGAQHDATNKTIRIKTSHFSDWSLFRSLGIEPQEDVISPGENLTLRVYKYIYHDDLLASLLPDLFEAPIQEKRLLEAKIVEEWSLGGPGNLNGAGNSATYRAPQQIQEPVVVAISARIKSPNNNLLLLVANITVAKEGLTFRINGGQWIDYPNPMVGMVIDGVASVTGSPAGTIKDMISIYWETNESEFMSWYEDYPTFVYNQNEYLWHYDYYESNDDVVPSPGYLKIFDIGEVGGYITGSFSVEKAGHYDDRLLEFEPYIDYVGSDHIEGFFRVKRHY